MRITAVALFVVCALGAGWVTHAVNASAETWRTMSPFYCTAYNRDIQWGPIDPYRFTVANTSPTYSMYIACGIPNDESLRHHDTVDGGYTSSLYVVGHTTTTGISGAAACVSYWSATGGSCAAGTTITGGTAYSVQLATTGAGSWAYSSPYDTPYLTMHLGTCVPASACTAYNTIRGYKIVRTEW